MHHVVKLACRTGAAGLLAVVLSGGFAFGQGAPASRPWLDPALLAKAKAEGSLTVYSSTNEGEGLPLWKIFEEATGIKVNYVRGADATLIGRMVLEFRANQPSYDIAQIATVNKMPPQMLAKYEPPEAKNLIPSARDPGKLWYGVYANYNVPAYNTEHVKASELPKTYDDFLKHKEWKGKVAIDGTDNEWLKAILTHYGEERGTKLVKDLVAALNPVVTVGHLALARSVGSGEYWISLNQYISLVLNVKLRGGKTDFWVMDPVTLFFGQEGINAKAPHPNAARLGANFILSAEAQKFLSKFGRQPTRMDVPGNPPGTVEEITKHKVISVLMKPSEEKTWQRKFDQLFKPR